MTDSAIIKAFVKAQEIFEEQSREKERLKAEIERLQQTHPGNRYPVCVRVRNGEIYANTLDDFDWLIGDIASEAIKEFAERFENEFDKIEEFYFEEEHENFVSANKVLAFLDNLVKEMIGE